MTVTLESITVNRSEIELASKKLIEYGVVKISGETENKSLDSLINAAKRTVAEPSILGSPGFFQKDCHKVIAEVCNTDDQVFDVLLDLTILSIIETANGNKDIMLEEMFVKHDFGDGTQYFPYHRHTGSYREKKNEDQPFSFGFMMYLHRTVEGSFSCSPQTQKIPLDYGEDLANYSVAVQKDVLDRRIQVTGETGDIILFDHRIFHGPSQPASVPRTVILGGFMDSDQNGERTKAPIKCYVHQLSSLSEKQLGILGFRKNTPHLKTDRLHYFSFKKANPGKYMFIKRLIKIFMSFELLLIKCKLK